MRGAVRLCYQYLSVRYKGNRMMRIKICGLTAAEDVRAAVAAGADALGFVFYSRSPRAVNAEQAAALVAEMPALVSAVGLFVDAGYEEVAAVLAQVPLDVLQFHGREPAGFCRQFGRRYVKAVPMRELADARAVQEYMAQYEDCAGFLCDAFGGGQQGGSGERFDWCKLPQDGSRVIVAGGLTPENVGELLAHYRPLGVDVSSGVESMPGRKSFARMQRFVANARRIV